MEFTISAGGGSFDVALNAVPYVIIETREAVERNRDVLDNADEIATYDARFELLFDHQDIRELFNPILGAAERLAKLTSGVVYESNKRRLPVTGLSVRKSDIVALKTSRQFVRANV
jgi:hypothetical protein